MLHGVGSHTVVPLQLDTALGPMGCSFGNPVVAPLPAPHGRGEVLAVTLFVFSSGPAAREAGELLFYRPL